MFFELFLRASMGERAASQIGRALSDGQIHPFTERRVQCRRVLPPSTVAGSPLSPSSEGAYTRFSQ